MRVRDTSWNSTFIKAILGLSRVEIGKEDRPRIWCIFARVGAFHIRGGTRRGDASDVTFVNSLTISSSFMPCYTI